MTTPPQFQKAVQQAHEALIRSERWALVEELLTIEFSRDHQCHDMYCQEPMRRAMRVRRDLQRAIEKGV